MSTSISANLIIFIPVILYSIDIIKSDEILGCNGFVKSEIELDFSKIAIKLYTKQGSLKDQTECAPNNGYYFLPLYDIGEFILKIHPPEGWTFEPYEVPLNVDRTTDSCSLGKDINFYFKGFAVSGKVVSYGSTVGPAGVKIELIGGKTTPEVLTTANGSFLFTPILPGSYKVKASHSKLKLNTTELDVTVANENVNIPGNSFIIYGYEVFGSVTSDNEPITGVMFLLFSISKISEVKDIVTDCIKSPLVGFKAEDYNLNAENYICHVISDGYGKFLFKNVIPGEYTVVPFYKGTQNIKFDVHPQYLHFKVLHSELELRKPFQVTGFSVGGKVFWSKGGKPMSGANVLINNKQVTVTESDGSFHLESMRAGNYIISLKKDNVMFKDAEVKVTPNTPFLPDIFPLSYKVCGIVKFSNQAAQKPKKVYEVQFVDKYSSEITKTEVNTLTGENCVYLKAGVYYASVPVSAEEKNKGLQFAPIIQEVRVIDSPQSGIIFSQLKATVKGKVNCLDSSHCQGFIINIVSETGNLHLTTHVTKGGEYKIEDVLPGEYKVSLARTLEWCWDKETAPLVVSSAETYGPTFSQTGVSITFVSSHETKIRYKLVNDETKSNKPGKGSGEVLIAEGKSNICIDYIGEYEMEPIGCHGYLVPKIHWKSGPIVLTAISHAYTEKVVSKVKIANLLINIDSNEEKTQHPNILAPVRVTKADNEYFEYIFSIQLAEGEKVTLKPSASMFLFSPPSAEIIGKSDCTGEILFFAEMGKMLEGQVLRESKTPLAGAVVVVYDSGKNVLQSQTTKDDGYYNLGPFNSSKVYKLEAQKEGYVITGPLTNGNFNAHKLAEVVVEVKDKADGSPLQGVLLTLSGGESYRQNNITGADGKMTFLSLSPNQYYLRPMMKEYRFDPVSKVFSVEEGATINIMLKGKRIAYSAYGIITSLSGDPEAGVIVEAVTNTDDSPECNNLQEEATSEVNGFFRIRGLKPQCEYSVRLKSGPEINKHIRRATPDNLSVKVGNEDIRNLHLIVFRHISRTDLSVYISSANPEHLRSLKAILYREEVTVHSVRLSDIKNTPTFSLSSIIVTFPPLPADGRSYTMQLESTLSQDAHSYENQIVHFTANTSYRLVRFSFFPKTRMPDNELSHSTYFVIFLLFIGTVVYFNQPLVFQFLNKYRRPQPQTRANTKVLTSINNIEIDPLLSEGLLIEPVIGKRKAKPRKT